MYKVTVIMPVYNSEKYLKQAIDSVLQQSLREIELILVDDGSRDSSGDICDRYSQADDRVKVIHQKNKGICGARNAALDIAAGEYIAFADNDDECLPGWLEDNYNKAVKDSADMIKFGRITQVVDQSGKVIKENIREFEDAVYETEKLVENYIFYRRKGLFSAAWDGLYSNVIIQKNNICFDTAFRFGEEDVDFCLRFLKVSKKIVLTEGVYFKHFVRINHSTSSKFQIGALEKYDLIGRKEKALLDLFHVRYKQEDYDDLRIRHYLIPCLSLLYHNDCNWSFKKKREFLYRMSQSEVYRFEKCTRIKGSLWETSKVSAGVGFLFQSRRYSLLLLCAWIYRIVLRLKERGNKID